MHRTKLARTLLVLGLASCERAESTRTPLVDRDDRPAVGNIGQTGARTPLAGNIGQTGARTPLVAADGSPAVGNIGQTGAPRRPGAVVHAGDAPRTSVVDDARALAGRTDGARAAIDEGSITSRMRPGVREASRTRGGVRAAPARRPVTVRRPLAVRAPEPPRVELPEQPAVMAREPQPALEPLVTREQRPAVGNTPSKRAPRRTDIQREQPPALEPLETRERRPAVGNIPRKGGGE